MKNKIPYVVLERIQPIIDEYENLIEIDPDPGFAYKFDYALGKDFYFYVEHQDNDANINIRYRPISDTNLKEHYASVNVDQLVQIFKQWLTLMGKYAKINTIFDKISYATYQKEFLNDFKLVDPDADTKPFGFGQQSALYDYLDNIKDLLPAYQESLPEEKWPELAALEKECADLQNDIPSLTQTQTVKRLTKIWGKARKLSIPILKDLFKVFGNETMKELAKKGVELAGDLVYSIPGHFIL